MRSGAAHRELPRLTRGFMHSFVKKIIDRIKNITKGKEKMKKKEFPKYVYHKVNGPMIVYTKEGLNALGKGWKETPFKTNQEQDAQASQ